MDSDGQQLEKLTHTSLFVGLRLAFIAILLVFSFLIISPFLMILVWGIIISIGVFPLFKKLATLLKGNNKWASIILVLVAIAVLVVPFTLLIINFVDAIENFSNTVDIDAIQIPAPSETVKEWPVIGENVYNLWESSSNNISFLLEKVRPLIVDFVPSLLSFAGSVVGFVFQFIFAVIIAGVLFNYAEEGKKVAEQVFKTILGKNGENFVELSKGTITGVVQGIVGTAVIQAAFLWIGFYAIGLPGTSILTILVLILAMIQLPVLVIGLPIIIYVFNMESVSLTMAIIFSIWTFIGSASDNVLKPILLGRGSPIPMVVMFMGAIGGFLALGIIGLFVGAVVLAITYKVVMALVYSPLNE